MKITDLIQDNHNFNRGREDGRRMLRSAIKELGAGRSILVDRDNRIISGNKTVEAAIAAGITDITVVETTGDELVAVKRTDILLDSGKGRELALADNAIQRATFDWDEEQLAEMNREYDMDLQRWRAPAEQVKEPHGKGPEMEVRIPFSIVLSSDEYEYTVDKLRMYSDNMEEALLTAIENYGQE